MMRFNTTASEYELQRIARDMGMHYVVTSRKAGLTAFAVTESDARALVSELKREGWGVNAGWPRASYSSPRAYATASAHIRR